VQRGMRLYREAWWPLPKYETASVFWRHWFWTELFAARNGVRRCGSKRERFLIIKLAHIGDAMHIAPMIGALKAKRPDAEIDLLVGPWCEDLAARWSVSGDVLVYTPHLTLFHRGNRSQVRGWWEEWKFLRQLRDRHYSVIFSTSTLSMAEWMLIQAANPDLWIGADNPISAWYPEIPQQTEPYDSQAYEANRVGGLLRHIDMEPAEGLPGYPVRDDEVAWAEEQWLIADGRGIGASKRVVVAPGAGWPGKMWPAERFGELVNWLIGELGCRVILSGAPDESDLGGMIESACSDALNLIGQTSFGQTAGLVKTADLLICNDSGPLHLAAAFGTPSVALFGPTVASKWHPPGSQHVMIQKKGFCKGCVGWHPVATCLHDGACMKAIAVDEVAEAVRELLSRKDSVA
jgi:ADP-heptose:LPS heptosyltransferase